MINVLEQAGDIVSRRWRNTGKGWRVFLVLGIIIVGILGIVALVLWLLVRLVKGLTIGGFRNKDLYVPRMRSR